MKKFDIVTIIEIILTIIVGLLAFFMLPLIGLPIVAVCIVTVFYFDSRKLLDFHYSKKES